MKLGKTNRPSAKHVEIHTDSAPFHGHKGLVYRVAIPDDLRFILSVGSDGTLRQWNSEDTRNSRILYSSDNSLVGLSVTPDGSMAAISDIEGNVVLLNPITGEILRNFRAHKREAGTPRFLLQTKELVTVGQDGFLRLWDLGEAALKRECKVRLPFLFGVAATPDGEVIVAAAHNSGLLLWDKQATTLKSLCRENVANHSPVLVNSTATIAVTGTEEGSVVIWDLIRKIRLSAIEGHAAGVNALAMTSDETMIVSGGQDGTIRLWWRTTGAMLAVLRGHSEPIWGIACTPKGDRVVSASEDGTVRIWHVPPTIPKAGKASKRIGYVNAKIVIVGESGVGKSGLALRLWHNRWEKTESSHGMEIRKLDLPEAPGDDGIEHEVWLWDLAGQPDYRLVHQLFMEQTSLALLVFDPQDPRLFETIAYWQSALDKVTKRHVPGILVAGRADRPGLRLSMEEVSLWANQRGLNGPIVTSAKLPNHPGCTELRAAIAQLPLWSMIEWHTMPEIYHSLKVLSSRRRMQKAVGAKSSQPSNCFRDFKSNILI